MAATGSEPDLGDPAASRGWLSRRLMAGRIWLIKPRSMLSALILWSCIGILLGGVVEIVFAQMASGIWFWEWRLSLDSGRWYDVTRSAIATVGLFGLGGAALLAYRRQHTTEEQHALDKEKQSLELRKQVLADTTDLRARYTAAAAQLGHDAPAVRLAGVHAIGALADDWHKAGSPQQQKVCIDLLCAYLRMAYDPESDRAKEGEREVRQTIIKVVSAHLQDPDAPETWCGHDLDFTGAVFDGGDLRRTHFIGGDVLFTGAIFSHGLVSFADAKFSGGVVDFDGAKFSSDIVSFRGALFKAGIVSFCRAEFTGKVVSFARAMFSAPSVTFAAAQFSGAEISFFLATFCGGEVSFSDAIFSDGEVFFSGAAFSAGEVSFRRTVFTGARVYFDARMGVGDESYPDENVVVGTAFSGARVDFSQANFVSGFLHFEAWFGGGNVIFDDATFRAPVVYFEGSDGSDAGRVSFSDPLLSKYLPVVPWPDGPSPAWVRPAIWPPTLVDAAYIDLPDPSTPRINWNTQGET